MTAGSLLWTACDRASGPVSTGVYLLSAGDIGYCQSDGDEATAKLLDTLPGTIATLGDNVYPSSGGSYAECFAPSWGRHKARIRPVPGNHDYEQSSDAYYNYFGAAAGLFGKGYYSYNLGAWHLIALNTEIGTAQDAPQIQWLKADLATTSQSCALVYWHEPRFSSGPHGNWIGHQQLWQLLYDAKVDIVLNGHDHDYERFAPQTASGQADPVHGIREFVVGTGGAPLYQFVSVQPNSELRSDTTFGLLRLTLFEKKYHWEFIGVDGTVIDSGDGSCH